MSAWPWICLAALACAVGAFGQYGLSRGALWGLLPLVVAGYGRIPTLLRWTIDFVPRRRRYFPLLVWTGSATLLYIAGTRRVAAPGVENYYFTLGTLAAGLALHASLRFIEVPFRRYFPHAGERVYSVPGNGYFFSAIVALAMLAPARVIKNQFLTEQLGVLVYFLVLLGVLNALWPFWRSSKHEDEVRAERAVQP